MESGFLLYVVAAALLALFRHQARGDHHVHQVLASILKAAPGKSTKIGCARRTDRVFDELSRRSGLKSESGPAAGLRSGPHSRAP